MIRKTLHRVRLRGAGSGREVFAVGAGTGDQMFYDAGGELLVVDVAECDPESVALIGEVGDSDEFEALVGIKPVMWATSCRYCGRLAVASADNPAGLCPRCYWAAREDPEDSRGFVN